RHAADQAAQPAGPASGDRDAGRADVDGGAAAGRAGAPGAARPLRRLTARVVLAAAQLRAGVRRLGAELSAAYGDGVVLVAVLKGSVPFLADLVRVMTIVPEVDFLGISSYAEGTGRVRIVKDLDADIGGRDVVLV